MSPPLVRVFHGRQEIGEVHQSTFMLKQNGPTVLTLGGRAWRAKHVDWPRRKAFVEPTEERGRSRWLGTGQPLRFELCQAMVRVLAGVDAPAGFSRRARDFVQGLRERYDWMEPERSFLVAHDDGFLRWWTFAGRLVNAALANALGDQAAAVKCDNLSIQFDGGVDLSSLRAAAERCLSEQRHGLAVPLDEAFVAELKFAVCLPAAARERELAARYELKDDVDRLARYPVSVVRVRG